MTAPGCGRGNVLKPGNSGCSNSAAWVGCLCGAQHVTWMIALVSSGSSCNTLMALIVGRISNLTLCCFASRSTSFITGNLPYAPVPITSWRHFPRYVLRDRQWRVPKVVSEFLGRRFLAVTNLPAVDDHIVFVGAVVNAERAKGEMIEAHLCLLAVKDGVTNSSLHVGGVQPSRQQTRPSSARSCDHDVELIGSQPRSECL
jgi:hypothetical protein